MAPAVSNEPDRVVWPHRSAGDLWSG